MPTEELIARPAPIAVPRTYQVRFPEDDLVPQDEEWCEVLLDDRWRRFRFHDYDAIYSVPGLYERIFYRALKCNSPRRVVGMLDGVLSDHGVSPTTLRVLDVGAGNGMVGSCLREMGVPRLIGVDIIPEAAGAAERDRPGVYDAYHIVDLTDVEAVNDCGLGRERFDAIITVAALGFGDIPPLAFAQALALAEPSAWVAFNIKQTFLDRRDDTGFARLIRRLIEDGTLRQHAMRRYLHRMSASGERLFYVAMVVQKTRDLPTSLMAELEAECAAG
ncbi:MAG: hypothetical protein KDA20_10305 [Phycisphaerales bacterium]|nr:hypothetical protein [Phycisphaerales bacterium]